MAKKFNKKKKIAIISAVLCVVLVLGVVFIAFKPEEKIKVETVNAKKDTISETLDITGTVSSLSEKTFTLPDGVKVLSVNVREGDIVAAGDIIATFDTSSLNISLDEKKVSYNKAKNAYEKAQKEAISAKSKIDSVKSQITELESQIETLKAKEANSKSITDNSVKVSESDVKKFGSVAKLFGKDYSDDISKKILSSLLSSGTSMKDLSAMIDNLKKIAGSSVGFDFSSLGSMGGAGTAAEMTLIQLKAQLATLELQSDDSIVSIYKKIAEKAKTSYEETRNNVSSMRDGWKAEKSGIISRLNIQEGQTSVNGNGAKADIDINSILSAATSGGDVSSLINSFFSTGETAVKILYYPLVVDIALSKYDVLDVAMNQKATVKSADGQLHDAEVSYISAVANSSGSAININSIMGGSSSSTVPAQVTIKDAGKSFIVGTDVDVSIVTKTAQNAIVVPVEAINIDGEDVYVYVLDEGASKAVRKEIKLGISNDTSYQVLSGISANDILIKTTADLKDGAKVSVK